MGKNTYDWMAVMTLNGDNVTMGDIMANGITPDNSTIKDRDFYKDKKEIRERFTDENGVFNEGNYDDFYDSALAMYNYYASEEFENEVINSVAKSPDDWRDPFDANRKDYTVSVVAGHNPYRISMGVGNIYQEGNPIHSVREIAQANYVHDEDGNRLDWTPNDHAGLFRQLADPSMALAVWDEDGTHEENGIEISHRKGEYKLDNGTPYYQILKPGEESYNREMLTYSDRITVDGTALNKIDVFDSDGLTKSITASTVEAIAKMAPLLIPGVGRVYGAIKAVKDLSMVAPTLGKTLEGLIVGSTDNGLGEALTTAENWVSRFKPSVSDVSREKFLTWENVANIFSDSAGQLFSQRQVFNLVNKLGKNNKLASNMASAYMALTSSGDSYSDFKNAGANDRAAAIGALANTAALFGLMRLDYFREFAEDTMFTAGEVQDATRKLVKGTNAKIVGLDASKAVVKATEKELKDPGKVAKLFNNVKDGATKIWKKTLGKPEPKSLMKQLWWGSTNEGFEEVMEEMTQDAIKGLFSMFDAFGVNFTGDRNEKLDFGFSLDDVISRYASAFFGGFLGGATFAGYNYHESRNLPTFDWDSMEDGDLRHILYLMQTDHGDEVLRTLDAMYKHGKIGNKNLSAKMEFGKFRTNDNGEMAFLWSAGTDGDNQNKYVYENLKEKLTTLNDLIHEKGITWNKDNTDLAEIFTQWNQMAEAKGVDINSLIQMRGSSPIIDYIFKTGLSSSTMLDDIIDFNKKIVSAEQKVIDASKAIEKDKKDEDAQKKYKDATKEREDLIKQRDDIISGKTLYKYAAQVMFTAHPKLQNIIFDKNKTGNKPFIASNVKNYVQERYGKKFDSLTDEQKSMYTAEYNQYMQTKGVDQLKSAFKIFMDMNYLARTWLPKFDKKFADKKFNYYYSENLDTGGRTSKLAAWERIKASQKTLDIAEKLINTQINERLEELQINPEEKSEVEAAVKSDSQLRDMMANKEKLAESRKASEAIIASLESDLPGMWYSALSDKGSEKLDDALNAIYFEEYDLEDLVPGFENMLDYYRELANEKMYNPDDYLLHQLMSKADGMLNAVDNPVRTFISEADPNMVDMSEGEPQIIDKNLALSVNAADHAINMAIGAFLNRNLNDIPDIVQSIKDAFDAMNSFGSDSLKGQLSAYGFNGLLNALNHLATFEENGRSFNLDILTMAREIGKVKTDVIEAPALELLKSHELNIADKTLDILELIEKQRISFSQNSKVNEFEIDSFTRDSLKQVLYLLNMIEASTTVAGDGYNETLNQFLPSDFEKYAVISDNTSKILLEDINFLRGQITALLNIAEGRMIEKTELQKAIEINCYPKFFTSLFQGAELPDKSETLFKKMGDLIGLKNGRTLNDLLNEAIDEAGLDGFDINNIKAEEYNQTRRVISKFETLLRKEALKNGISFDEDFGRKLVDVLGVTDLQQEDLSVDEDFAPTDYQKLMYLMSVFGVDSEDFYSNFKKVAAKSEFAPFFNQEQNVREIAAAYKNKELAKGIVDALYDAIHKANENTNDETTAAYLSRQTKWYDTIFINGGTGTGKSTAIMSVFLDMYGNDSYILSAKIDSLLDYKTGSIGKYVDDEKKKITTDEFLRKCFGDNWKQEAIKKYDGGQFGDMINETWINEHVKEDESLKGKTLIIDEGSLYSVGEIQVILAAAEKNNMFTIFLGDEKQNSYLDKGGTPEGYFDGVGLVGMSLSETLRADNQAKYNNFKEINTVLTNVSNFAKSDIKNYSPKNASDYMLNLISRTKKIDIGHKYEKGVGLWGDMNVNSRGELKAVFDDLSTILNGTDKTVAIICDEDSFDYWNSITLPKNFTIQMHDKVQGGEFDYVLLDCNFSGSNMFAYTGLRDLYTMLNRARIGSAVNGLTQKFGNIINVSESKRGDATFEPLSDDVKKLFKEWKLKTLDGIGEAVQSEENNESKTKANIDSGDALAEENDKGEDGDLDNQNDENDLSQSNSTTNTSASSNSTSSTPTSNTNTNTNTKTNTNTNTNTNTKKRYNPTINSSSGKRKPLTDEEIKNIESKQSFVEKRKMLSAQIGAINYDESIEWFNKKLMAFEEKNANSAFKKFFSEEDKPTKAAWTRFVKIISGIVVDNIQNPETPNFGDVELSRLYNMFLNSWNNETEHKFYILPSTNGSAVINYRFSDMLIPIALIKSESKKIIAYSVESDPEFNVFQMVRGMDFSKIPDNRTEVIGSKINNILMSKRCGVLAIQKSGNLSLDPRSSTGDINTYLRSNAGSIISKKGVDAGRKMFMETRSKTEALFTYNLYSYECELDDYFENDFDSSGKIHAFTKMDWVGERVAMKSINRPVTLKELFAIADVIRYITSEKEVELNSNLLDDLSEKIKNKSQALKWLIDTLGTHGGLEVPSDSNEVKRAEQKKNNERIKSNNMRLLSESVRMKLMSYIYVLIKQNPRDFNFQQTKEALYLTIDLTDPAYTTKSGKYYNDLCFRVKQRVEKIQKVEEDFSDSYILIKSKDRDGHYDIYSTKIGLYWKPEKIVGTISQTDIAENGIEAIYDWVKSRSEYNGVLGGKSFESSVLDGNFEFILGTLNESENGLYQNLMSVHNMLNEFFGKMPDINIGKINDLLLKTEQFKNGIYLYDAVGDIFGDKAENTVWREVNIEKTASKYASDFVSIKAPIYQMDTRNADQIDLENSDDDFDKGLLPKKKRNEKQKTKTFTTAYANKLKVGYNFEIKVDNDGNFEWLLNEKPINMIVSDIYGNVWIYNSLEYDYVPSKSAVSFLNKIRTFTVPDSITIFEPLVSGRAHGDNIDTHIFQNSKTGEYFVFSIDTRKTRPIKKTNFGAKQFIDDTGRVYSVVEKTKSYDSLISQKSERSKFSPKSGNKITRDSNGTFRASHGIDVNSVWCDKNLEKQGFSGTIVAWNKNGVLFKDGTQVRFKNEKVVNRFKKLESTAVSVSDRSWAKEFLNQAEDFQSIDFDSIISEGLNSFISQFENQKDFLKEINSKLEVENQPFEIIYTNGKYDIKCVNLTKKKISAKLKSEFNYEVNDNTDINELTTNSDRLNGIRRYFIDEQIVYVSDGKSAKAFKLNPEDALPQPIANPVTDKDRAFNRVLSVRFEDENTINNEIIRLEQFDEDLADSLFEKIINWQNFINKSYDDC